MVMRENVGIGGGSEGQYYGQMAADKIVQRLDAFPVSKRKSLFMGANEFAA
jgi:hypothetical protein